MIETLWFGSTELFQSIVQPPTVRADSVGYFDEMGFEQGGRAQERSNARARVFELVYPWSEASDSDAAELWVEYRDGEYGDAPFYFANPLAFDLNLFPPHWASPRLVEQEWPNIGAADPTGFAATAANLYRQPARKGTWPVTTLSGATPLTDSSIPFVIIPIPPGYTLHIGCTGAKTGTAVVRVEKWVNGAAAAGATTDLTLIGETSSTRMNATVDGTTYAYAKVFITRTTSGASTMTPISMMAQLWPTGESPTLTGSHIRGKGFTGVDFSDETLPESWLDGSSGRHYKSFTVMLAEVGL